MSSASLLNGSACVVFASSQDVSNEVRILNWDVNAERERHGGRGKRKTCFR